MPSRCRRPAARIQVEAAWYSVRGLFCIETSPQGTVGLPWALALSEPWDPLPIGDLVEDCSSDLGADPGSQNYNAGSFTSA